MLLNNVDHNFCNFCSVFYVNNNIPSLYSAKVSQLLSGMLQLHVTITKTAWYKGLLAYWTILLTKQVENTGDVLF